MKALKIAVIGGGSTYTPELIEGFLQGDLPVRELALMDIDAGKLAVVGGLAQRMAARAQHSPAVTLASERASALDDADVVITQLRVGGLAARVRDERIPLAHGLVGQETTGPGGFAKALRTIPVLLEIDHEMAVRCPGAWLINFTNPSGLVTEALRRHGRGRMVGLCNYPLTLKMNAARALAVDESRMTLAYFGLNHLSWARVRVDGRDCTEELIEKMIDEASCREISGYAFASERLRALKLIPSGYLRYYYDREQMVAEMRAAPRTRGERVQAMEASLLTAYADPALCEKPAGLQERGGAWYSTAAVRLVRDLHCGNGGVHVLNVPNDGAIAALPPEAIVEVPAVVRAESAGATAEWGTIAAMPGALDADGRADGCAVPPEVTALIMRVKRYEELTVEAALTGSRQAAAAALAAHPLLDGRHAAIPALLTELLEAHRAYLPQFFA